MITPAGERLGFTKDELETIRSQFPILSQKINNKPLIYLDNGATTQKPKTVIDALVYYYEFQNANIHRGVHSLSRQITIKYEEARKRVQEFLGALHSHEIIFTKGTTDSINLVANSYASEFLKEGDEILISGMEHHSNILPWQHLVNSKGIRLKVIPVLDNGELDMQEFEKLLTDKVKLVAITHVSNTLGTINPVKEIIRSAHQLNIPVLVDAAQSVPHMNVNVVDLDCDFLVFSAHKVYGPTGIGVLYAKEKFLEKMPPYQLGGGIIKTVTFEQVEWAELPLKFEAGTPHIEGAIGLAAALDYVNTIGLSTIAAHENHLLKIITDEIKLMPEVEILGSAFEKAGVLSFNVKNQHPFDVGTLLDQMGIAVRTGHHCTQPLMQRFGIQGTVRASLGVYNTEEEMHLFIQALKKTIKMLS